jgi:lysophospholipase
VAKGLELKQEEAQLTSADGTRLHVRTVRPPEIRGRVAMIHGFAEHGGRYKHVQAFLAQHGFASSVVDLRGHGLSEGRRTFVERWGDYLDDAQAHLQTMSADTLPGPLFALGHSMGGLILTRLIQARGPSLPELRGAVVTSPFFALKMQVPIWKELAGRALSKMLPTFRLPTDLDLDHLSTDPTVGQQYEADPLVTGSTTTRWFTEAMNAHKDVFRDVSSFGVPVFLQHGDDDMIADPQATVRFHREVPSEDKTLERWPGLRHELFNERAKDEVLAKLVSWLEARL